MWWLISKKEKAEDVGNKMSDWSEQVNSQEQVLASRVGALSLKKDENSISVLKQNENNSALLNQQQQQQVDTQQPSKSEQDAHGEEDDIEASKEDASLLRKILRSKLVSTQTNIEILRKDPRSPLYSVKTFEALNLLVIYFG